MAIAAVLSAEGAAARAAERGGAPGEQRRWSLEFRAQIGSAAGERPTAVEVQGDWVATISAARPGEYDVEFRLENARVGGEVGAAADGGAQEAVARRLARPFWMTCRDDGAFTSVHFFQDVDAGDRNLLQMIATELQLVRAGGDRASWMALERDGAGEYVAVYRRDAPDVVIKRKLKYVRTDGVAGTASGSALVDVVRSESRFTLDSDGGVRTAEARNETRAGAPIGPGGQLAIVTETRLTGLRKSSAPERVGSLSRAAKEVTHSGLATQQPDAAQSRAQRDKRLIEGRSTASLLEPAAGGASDPQLPERLQALFRQRPEAIREAVALLRKSGPQRRITNALAASGAAPAVEALGVLAADRATPPPLRIDALTAFALAPGSSLAGMRIAAALWNDPDRTVASAALIVSGSLAAAARAEHPADADSMDAALIARYAKANSASERRDLLAALGNSNGPGTFPAMAAALRDGDPQVRAAAARAMRLAPGAESERLLAATITGDADPVVRAAAIFSAGFRHRLGLILGDALTRAAKSDPVEYVRSDAISLLRHNPDASPHLAEALQWISEHDPKEGVRRLAREALASIAAAK